MVRTRRAARPGAGEAHELNAKARTRKLAFEVALVRSEVAGRPPPERSGLGALRFEARWLSGFAFDDAKRWGVRTGTSEAAGVTGVSLAR